MGATYGLSVLGIAIILIIVMCVRFKINAFLALITACLFLGIASGMPLASIGGSIEKGMAGTLGFLAPVLALGAFMGKMMEISGGAERLAKTLISFLGATKAHWAMLIIGYICGIPVFFQVGIILLMPLAIFIAKESKMPILQISLSLIAGLITVHCIVPPHPAAMAITNVFHADVGKVIVLGLVLGFPAAVVGGPIFAKFIAKRVHIAIPDVITGKDGIENKKLPSFGGTLFLVLLPLILMVTKTIVDLSGADSNASYMPIVNFIGHPIVALFISAVCCLFFLGVRRGFNSSDLGKYCEVSLLPMASILLVIGAAGGFNKVIMDCGLGDILQKTLTEINMHPIIMAWLIAAIMRFSLGSATVAMITSAGFIAPVLAVNPVDPALICVAVGAGAIGWSHVTDSGFWFFKEVSGMTVKEMYRTYSVSTCIISVIGLITCYLASFVI